MNAAPRALPALAVESPASGPRDWPSRVLCSLQRDAAVVRILLAEVRGSTPREAGVGMLVSAQGVCGTIGGGRLEWDALAQARGLLENPAAAARLQRVVLGADLGQCCGGVVQLWIERYTRADLALLRDASEAARRAAAVLITKLTSRGVERRLLCEAGGDLEVELLLRTPRAKSEPRLRRRAGGEMTLWERLDDAFVPLWLYGAGHVGRALAQILVDLPLRVTWIDSRADAFPAELRSEVSVLCSADPVESVATAPAGTRFVVMTHSHSLDYALCRAILERGDFAWAGLIGSHSKAARFRSRLGRDGKSAASIARLVCPIGIEGIRSKWPAAIAVSVAAQLLRGLAVEGDAGDAQAPPIDSAPPQDCAAGGCAGCGSVAVRAP